MKVVIAPDKFKGTLTSDAVSEVICRAINEIAPENVVCKKFAIADGGDGSLNQNDIYTGWKWIIVRDSNGNWVHKDHGYA